MQIFTTILTFLFSAGTFTPVDKTLPELDGIINKSEWLNAKEYDLVAGGKLYVLYREKDVYVAIKGNLPGWAHVYLHWKDSVKVLHASAALGSRLYTDKKEIWHIHTHFNWELRDTVYNEDVKQKMEKYYANNGWVANNNSMGNMNSLEFRIDLQRFDKDEVSFAVVYASDAMLLSYYPSRLADDTLMKELLSGRYRGDVQFVPSTWSKLKQ